MLYYIYKTIYILYHVSSKYTFTNPVIVISYDNNLQKNTERYEEIK